MDRTKLLVVIGGSLLATWLIPDPSGQALPPCNGQLPRERRFCMEPFSKCEHFHGGPTPCSIGHYPAFISPSCYTTGGANDYCETIDEQELCVTVYECVWDDLNNKCRKGDRYYEQYVTKVASGDCESNQS
jgi:hypothetical protein